MPNLHPPTTTESTTQQLNWIKPDQISLSELGQQLEVGDVVFIHIRALPFMKIANATASWTNHVGVVVDTSGSEPLIAESCFPFSCTTTLKRFVRRSGGARIAVKRVATALTDKQRNKIKSSAQKRSGIFYDTGFDLHSSRQFCSRFVREVLAEATGIEVGHIESLDSLFKGNPAIDLRFWKLWYFGNIPWHRQTVTPASLLRCQKMNSIFDGVVCDEKRRGKQLTDSINQNHFSL